jgi:hypothetical protein
VQSRCVPFPALFLTAICKATSIDACTEQATVIKAPCEALVTNQHQTCTYAVRVACWRVWSSYRSLGRGLSRSSHAFVLASSCVVALSPACIHAESWSKLNILGCRCRDTGQFWPPLEKHGTVAMHSHRRPEVQSPTWLANTQTLDTYFYRQ